MGYIKADEILPQDLLRRVQEYAEGRLLYIPRRDDRRSVGELAERYYLSEKSIQRILRDGAPSESDADKEGIQ